MGKDVTPEVVNLFPKSGAPDMGKPQKYPSRFFKFKKFFFNN